MQLQSESNPSLNTVTAYEQGMIAVNAVAYRHAVWFAPQGAVQSLPVTDIEQITPAMLKQMAGVPNVTVDPLAFLEAAENATPVLSDDVAQQAAQIVLIGTGARQRFLPTALLQTLTRLGIGVETMSTPAAARTYNILMMEGRRVVAVLLPL